MTDTYTYDVFGALRSQVGASANPYRFTGELQDSQVARGLYYLRARYYDPALGRFLGRDPFTGFTTIPQTQNRYPYVLNNPALLIDPTGLFCVGPFCTPKVPLPPPPPLPPPLRQIVDAAGDARECLGNISGCANNAVEDYLMAPILDAVGNHDAAACVRKNGAKACVLNWVGQQTARILVGEKSYLNFNATGAAGVAAMFGVQMSYQEGVYTTWGLGVGTTGVNVSLTGAPNQSISEGLACGVQVNVPVSPSAGVEYDVGFSGLFGPEPSFYGETGGYVGTPGGSAICYQVSPILK